MKILIAVLLCLALPLISRPQGNVIQSTTGKEIGKRINELHKNGIDTIICYYVDCVGSVHTVEGNDTSCHAFDVKYLLWSDKRKYLIQRFDECADHLPLIIKPTFFYFLKTNLTEIKAEQLKYPEYDIVEGGEKKTYSTSVDHSCHSTFEICIGKTRINKDIDAYALETKFVDDKYLNKNFYANKKSVLNKLKVITERVVDDYNKKLKTKKAP
jgi:hypothetical protein